MPAAADAAVIASRYFVCLVMHLRRTGPRR
jgi:hypothetical protein